MFLLCIAAWNRVSDVAFSHEVRDYKRKIDSPLSSWTFTRGQSGRYCKSTHLLTHHSACDLARDIDGGKQRKLRPALAFPTSTKGFESQSTTSCASPWILVREVVLAMMGGLSTTVGGIVAGCSLTCSGMPPRNAGVSNQYHIQSSIPPCLPA